MQVDGFEARKLADVAIGSLVVRNTEGRSFIGIRSNQEGRELFTALEPRVEVHDISGDDVVAVLKDAILTYSHLDIKAFGQGLAAVERDALLVTDSDVFIGALNKERASPRFPLWVNVRTGKPVEKDVVVGPVAIVSKWKVVRRSAPEITLFKNPKPPRPV